MNHQKAVERQRFRRRNHVRSRVVGTAERPRLTVFRSSKHIYAQLIDDLNGHTLAACSTVAKAVGIKLAAVAKERGIAMVAFDRGHYRYHGRIKALADGAREGGLKF